MKKWRDSLQNGINLADVDDRRPSINNLSLAASQQLNLVSSDDKGDEADDGGEESDECDEGQLHGC